MPRLHNSTASACCSSLDPSDGVCHPERDSHLHETTPTRFHVDCADVGPRIQYVMSGEGLEELGRPGYLAGDLSSGNKRLPIRRRGNTGGVSRITLPYYCGPAGLGVLWCHQTGKSSKLQDSSE